MDCKTLNARKARELMQPPTYELVEIVCYMLTNSAQELEGAGVKTTDTHINHLKLNRAIGTRMNPDQMPNDFGTKRAMIISIVLEDIDYKKRKYLPTLIIGWTMTCCTTGVMESLNRFSR